MNKKIIIALCIGVLFFTFPEGKVTFAGHKKKPGKNSILNIQSLPPVKQQPPWLKLSQEFAYRNPFNADQESTGIWFMLNKPATVSIIIKDRNGDIINPLTVHSKFGEGKHMVAWYGIDAKGTAVPAGNYTYEVSAVNPPYGDLLSGTLTLERNPKTSSVYTPPTLLPPARALHTRVVCNDPCPPQLTKEIQYSLNYSFSQKIDQLERAMGYELPAGRKPFTVHLTRDSSCTSYPPNTVHGNTFINKDGKGEICIFATPENFIAEKNAFFHEISHHYFMNHDASLAPILEELTPALTSIAVYGLEYRWNKECNPSLIGERKNYPYVYKLCTAGLTFNRIPELARIYRRYEENQPNELISLYQFKEMLKELLKKDVSWVFE